jgi:4-alpha-glucanotransferase
MTDTIIFETYDDNQGRVREAAPEVLARLREALGTDMAEYPAGTGKAAWLPSTDFRQSGLALQLYALRRNGDWGMGDFTSLRLLMEWGAAQGLSYIGINPVHALRAGEPEACSPYYPSSRLALNPLYIDPDALASELEIDLPATYRGEVDTDTPLIDYESVSSAKMSALRHVHRASDFSAENLPVETRAHAIFEAFDEEFGRPPDFAHGSPEEQAFLSEYGETYAFHAFVQWAADRQLREAASAGMETCSLYLDLAVGASPSGSEVWAHPDRYVPGVRLGAPPDLMAPQGQDWGLTPLHPRTLAREGGAGFKDILSHAARYAGAVRIDHVLGMNRQYFIPKGFSSADATYAGFPQNLLLDVIAAVSREHRAVMIGEDLGTVPDGLTDALHDAAILSYEVSRWSRDEDGTFLPANAYPHLCLAAATTHDIAPMAGWLTGSDLQTRLDVGHLSEEHYEDAANDREEERNGLLELWGLDRRESDPDRVVRAAHRFLASTSAGIAMMSLEDLLLQEEMMNLPGTMQEHPNWRRRYGETFETWSTDRVVLERLGAGLR